MKTRKHNGCFVLMVGMMISASLFSQIPREGLIGEYHLDNADLSDSSGYQHHMNSDGFFVGKTNDRFGRTDKALSLDGTYIGIPDPSVYNFADSASGMSISLWIHPINLYHDWIPLVTKWPGFGRGGYFLGINPGTHQIRWNVNLGNIGPPIESQTKPFNGVWYHVVATYDGSEAKLYVDGVLEAQATYNSPLRPSNFTPFAIALQGDGNSFNTFLGDVDDVLIYDRAVSQEEVNQLMNQYATSNEVLMNQLTSFDLLPNPATDQLSIAFDAEIGKLPSVSLYDLQGRLQLHQQVLKDEPISLTTLPSGMYMVVLTVEDQLLGSRKLIKQ
ncbi:MAG: LamG-like jellyroll fold domain-containing protein [Bacteroidota bacterium]